MKKLESLKKAELIDIILREDEVEKELCQEVKDLQFDVDQAVAHCEELQTQLNSALEAYENSREMFDKELKEYNSLNEKFEAEKEKTKHLCNELEVISRSLNDTQAFHRQSLRKLEEEYNKEYSRLSAIITKEHDRAEEYKALSILIGIALGIIGIGLFVF